MEIDGVRMVLETYEVSHFGYDEHIQVFFQHGWVKSSVAASLLLKNVPSEVEIFQSKPGFLISRPIPTPAWSWAFKREAEAFIRCLQAGEPFESSAQDTLTDVRLCEDIYHSWLTRLGEI